MQFPLFHQLQKKPKRPLKTSRFYLKSLCFHTFILAFLAKKSRPGKANNFCDWFGRLCFLFLLRGKNALVCEGYKSCAKTDEDCRNFYPQRRLVKVVLGSKWKDPNSRHGKHAGKKVKKEENPPWSNENAGQCRRSHKYKKESGESKFLRIAICSFHSLVQFCNCFLNRTWMVPMAGFHQLI